MGTYWSVEECGWVECAEAAVEPVLEPAAAAPEPRDTPEQGLVTA
jgi:hypothetical protein